VDDVTSEHVDVQSAGPGKLVGKDRVVCATLDAKGIVRADRGSGWFTPTLAAFEIHGELVFEAGIGRCGEDDWVVARVPRRLVTFWLPPGKIKSFHVARTELLP
jgi:hypothetical protein